MGKMLEATAVTQAGEQLQEGDEKQLDLGNTF